MKRRWRWPLGCLSLILVVVLYRVISVYQWRTGECSAAQGSQPAHIQQTYPPRLLVMQYNIEGHAALLSSDHIQKIADAINQVKPDVVGLNEVHRNTWQSRFSDNVAELQRRTHMSGTFSASYSQAGGQFGNLILTRGKITRVLVHHLPGFGEPRSLVETDIEIDGGKITMFVTHLTAWERLNRATRTIQLRCVAAIVRTSRYPYILTGDMNAPPDSPEIMSFRTDNTLQMAGNGAGATQRLMNLWIDYIFTDRGWTVLSARPVDIGPSDHRPLVAEIRHETATTTH